VLIARDRNPVVFSAAPRPRPHTVGYRTFSEQYLDSCGIFRDAVISILSVIAKQERVRLAEPDARRAGAGP